MKKVLSLILALSVFVTTCVFADSMDFNDKSFGYSSVWSDDFEEYEPGRVEGKKNTSLSRAGVMTWKASTATIPYETFSIENSPIADDGRGQVLSFEGRRSESGGVVSYTGGNNLDFQTQGVFEKEKLITISFDLYMPELRYTQLRLYETGSKYWNAFTIAANGAITVGTGTGKTFITGDWQHIELFLDFDKKLCDAYINGAIIKQNATISDIDCISYGRMTVGNTDPLIATYMDNFDISVARKFTWEDDFEEYDAKSYVRTLKKNNTNIWMDSVSTARYSIVNLNGEHSKVLSMYGDLDSDGVTYKNGNTISSYNLSNTVKPFASKISFDVYFDDYRYAEFRVVGDKDTQKVLTFNNGTINFIPSNKKGTYETKKWYSITTYIDFMEQKYSLYLGDDLVIDNEKFNSTSNFLQNIMIQAGKSTPVIPMYIDNVSIEAKPDCLVDVLAKDKMLFDYIDDNSVHFSGFLNNEGIILVAKYKDASEQELIYVEKISPRNVFATNSGKIYSEVYHLEDGETIKSFWFDSIENIRPLSDFSLLMKTTDEDFDEIKDKWCNYLLGDGLESGSKVNSKITTITDRARSIKNGINYDLTKNYLWKEYPIDSTANMSNTYNYIFLMAKAWGTKSSALYHNNELLTAIKYCIDYMYENCYGEDEKNGTGWKSIWDFNWWDWMIGTPQYLLNTMMILHDQYTQADIQKYTSLFGHIISVMDTDITRGNSVEKSYNMCAYAALTNNKQLLRDTQNTFALLYQFSNSGAGVKEDYSYLDHNNIAYNAVYGLFFDRSLPAMSILSGSRFEDNSKYDKFIYDYIVNGFEPLIYNGGIMQMTAGRNASKYSEQYSCVTLVRSILDCIQRLDDSRSAYLKRLVKRILQDSNSNIFYNDSRMYLSHVKQLEDIENDSSIVVQPYMGSKVFYNMDRTVWQRGDYAAALAMSSSRVANYESCNHTNQKGWYTGDGMLYIYRADDKNQYNEDYGEYADPYKRPGTTVDTQEREAVSIKVGQEYFSGQDFVGGAVMDGLYSVSAMALESFHNSKHTTVTDNGSGGALPVHNCSLTAKKSYFMFDDEVVCLGSDIDANDGYNVMTVIENRKLNSTNGSERFFVDDQELQNTTKQNAKWAFLEGTGGYYFPDSENVTFQKKANTKNFFEMWIDHGINPNNADYSYVILPCKNENETKLYAQAPDITVLRNDNEIQAVRENKLNMTGIVFWNSGSFDGVNTSNPLIVMKKQTSDGLELSLSDPTQKLSNVTITLDGVFDVDNSKYVVDTTILNQKTQITINMSDVTGNTVNLFLTHK